MFRPSLRTTFLLDTLIEKGTEWVRAQRETHRPDAFPLPQPESGLIAPFFKRATLDAVRFRHVPEIENPAFYGFLGDLGDLPIDFSRMAGVTFVDTVLLSDAFVQEADLLSLLFHECVHVAQYQVLGVDEFIRRYVQGWASNGMDYFSIPLERDAYELERQFRFARHRPFSVEEAVALRLAKR